MKTKVSRLMNPAFDRLRFEKYTSTHDLPAIGVKVGTHYFEKAARRYFLAKFHRVVVSPSRLVLAFVDSIQFQDHRTGRRASRIYRVKALCAVSGNICDADAAGIAYEVENGTYRKAAEFTSLAHAEKALESLVQLPEWDSAFVRYSLENEVNAARRNLKEKRDLCKAAGVKVAKA